MKAGIYSSDSTLHHQVMGCGIQYILQNCQTCNIYLFSFSDSFSPSPRLAMARYVTLSQKEILYTTYMPTSPPLRHSDRSHSHARTSSCCRQDGMILSAGAGLHVRVYIYMSFRTLSRELTMVLKCILELSQLVAPQSAVLPSCQGPPGYGGNPTGLKAKSCATF